MPNDQNSSQNRRAHYHRGRRGTERRNTERRTPPGPEPAHRDHIDVEQIMRDIRARISSRHGIDLTSQQIQELAARRLDAILEPRHVKPALLEQMRRAAGEAIEVPTPSLAAVAPFDEQELYTSHRGLVQWLRRVLNPILKLFFNPAPLARALSAQAAQSNAAAVREAELYSRQAEWNALHYEIIQRLVTELSRTTLEMQSLALRMEAVDAKLDFNERRVRAMELGAHQAKPASRPVVEATAPPSTDGSGPSISQPPAGGEGTSEGARRRRRRRRGRRSGLGGTDSSATVQPSGATESLADAELDNDGDADNGDEDIENGSGTPEPGEHGRENTALEPAHHFSLLQPEERYPSGESSPPSFQSAPSDPRGDATPAATNPASTPSSGDVADSPARVDAAGGPDSTEK
jgi:hypothetical protein